jgi:hypothetical protein
MHVHLGLLHALTVFAYVLIVGFFWRIGEMLLRDRPIGQAMAFIY